MEHFFFFESKRTNGEEFINININILTIFDRFEDLLFFLCYFSNTKIFLRKENKWNKNKIKNKAIDLFQNLTHSSPFNLLLFESIANLALLFCRIDSSYFCFLFVLFVSCSLSLFGTSFFLWLNKNRFAFYPFFFLSHCFRLNF